MADALSVGERRAALKGKISSTKQPQVVAQVVAQARQEPARFGADFVPPAGVCHRPFSSLVTNKEGDKAALAPCCVSWLKKDGIVRRYKTVSADDIAAYWSSEEMDSMRQSVLDGSYRYCDSSQCPFLYSRNFREAVYTTARGAYSESFPLVLQYGLDSSCNLSCPSCRSSKTTSDPLSGYGLDLDDVLSRGLRVLSANGSGEFFMDPRLLRLAREFDSSRFPLLEEFCLITNGQLLTPRMWSSLSPDFRGKLGSISVSLDASTPETYEKVRRGGRFSTVMSNIGYISSLVKSGQLCEFSLGFVLSEANFRDLPGFIELAYRMGACLVHVSPIQDWGSMGEDEYRSAAVHDPCHPAHQEYKEVLSTASALRKRYGLLSMGALGL